jgi:ribose-phosphate pyrophosphokinase
MDYFIAGSNEQALAKRICNIVGGVVLKHKISGFVGGESKVEIENRSLKGQAVYIVQSIFDHANDRLVELFLLADAIKNLGCKNIIAIIPYICYSRQDKMEQGGARGFRCIVDLIKFSGIKKIITVDLHNPLVVRDFGIPIINLSTAAMFSEVVRDRKNAIVVAPDIGATSRSKALARILRAPLIVAHKERHGSKVKIKNIPQIESVRGMDCYLMDDVLDTGETICSVAAELEKFSPKSILALVSHGLFAQAALQFVEKSYIQRIYITDSVKNPVPDCTKVSVLKLAPIISNYLKK